MSVVLSFEQPMRNDGVGHRPIAVCARMGWGMNVLNLHYLFAEERLRVRLLS